MRPAITPSQTVGPFFADCMLHPQMCITTLIQPETVGERIRIEGRVLDGADAPVPDALVEIWQANAHGRYRHPADTRADAPLDPTFIGFGRSGVDVSGRYTFLTIKPGAVLFNASEHQAPHINVMVFARGMLNHAATRLYFDDEPANETDPVLRLAPAERRATLLARRMASADEEPGVAVYRFDITLQGAHETVFFQV